MIQEQFMASKSIKKDLYDNWGRLDSSQKSQALQ
jgi:hypothetical protein